MYSKEFSLLRPEIPLVWASKDARAMVSVEAPHQIETGPFSQVQYNDAPCVWCQGRSSGCERCSRPAPILHWTRTDAANMPANNARKPGSCNWDQVRFHLQYTALA